MRWRTATSPGATTTASRRSSFSRSAGMRMRSSSGWRSHIVKLFGKEPTFRITRSCPTVDVSGVNIGGFIEQIGAGGLSGALRVPPSLLRGPQGRGRGIPPRLLRGGRERRSAECSIGLARDAGGCPLPSDPVRDPEQHRRGRRRSTGIRSTSYAPRLGRSVQADLPQEHRLSDAEESRARSTASVNRPKGKSRSELLTLRHPADVLEIKPVLYEAARSSEGHVSQALYVFAHKFARGRTTITLGRAEQIIASDPLASIDSTGLSR